MFGQPRTGIDVVAPVRLQLFSYFFGKREERFQTSIFLDGGVVAPVHHLHRRVLRRRDGYHRIVEGDLASKNLLELS